MFRVIITSHSDYFLTQYELQGHHTGNRVCLPCGRNSSFYTQFKFR